MTLRKRVAALEVQVQELQEKLMRRDEQFDIESESRKIAELTLSSIRDRLAKLQA